MTSCNRSFVVRSAPLSSANFEPPTAKPKVLSAQFCWAPMFRFCPAFLLTFALGAQDPGGYIDLPGRPLPSRPIAAEMDRANAVFTFDDRRVVLENFKFKKPWIGKWQISFNVRNRTDHSIESLDLKFVFFNNAGEVLSSPNRVLGYRIALLPEGDETVLALVISGSRSVLHRSV